MILNILGNLGLTPDPWQLEVLEGNHRRLLLNCARQAGKSTAVALLSLFEAVAVSDATILLLSRSQRQSAELFRIVATNFVRLNAPYLSRRTAFELELTNGSRIVSLPCNSHTIRGYSGVHMQTRVSQSPPSEIARRPRFRRFEERPDGCWQLLASLEPRTEMVPE